MLSFAIMLLGLAGFAPTGRERATEAIFFTAPWCEPCRAVAPVLQRLEQKFPTEFHVTPVDFDSERDAAARWDIHEIPVVIVLARDGRFLMRAEGADARTLSTLEKGITRAIEEARIERKGKPR